MRSLGDMRWINTYIGIPYKYGGRTSKGVDCYGLCKLVYTQEFCKELPDWLTDDVADLKIRRNVIHGVTSGNDWTDKDEPADGDFVICYRTKAAHHMGLYFAGGVLHCVDGGGVVFETLPRFRQKFTKVTFGEWHPCL